MTRVVIIGAGQAGFSVASKLRTEGYDGAITLIGNEPTAPYQRPPLSKAYLLGELGKDRLMLRPETYYEEHNITLLLGKTVDAIDPDAKTVSVNGETIEYDDLVISTGSRPKRLPAAIGGDLEGVFTIRTLADVDNLAGAFRDRARVLVVGGGYIGLEAAAVARKSGLDVVLIEAADRILQRVASANTSDFFRKLHKDHGVHVIEGVGLQELSGEHGKVMAARLSDGSVEPVDFVVVGIGVDPETSIAASAGLALENGIKTDEYGRTSREHIWAAGDCASFPWKGGRIRLESVPNAIEQAEAVALNILGADRPYAAKPWFWSDQYDVKLQIAGLNTGYDRVATRGDGSGPISFWYFKGDRLLAVDAANDPRSYMVGKRLIESDKSPDFDAVSKPETNLKLFL